MTTTEIKTGKQINNFKSAEISDAVSQSSVSSK